MSRENCATQALCSCYDPNDIDINISNRTLVIVKVHHVEIVRIEEIVLQEDTERTIEILEKAEVVTGVIDPMVWLLIANLTETTKIASLWVIYHLIVTGLN